jgi:hypothetical protein
MCPPQAAASTSDNGNPSIIAKCISHQSSLRIKNF